MPDRPTEADRQDGQDGQVATAKARLRATLLAARRSLPVEVRQAAAHRVQQALAALLAGYAGHMITGYVPFGAEPGGPELPETLGRAVGAGGRLLLPVLRDDRDLDWEAHGDPPGPRLGVSAVTLASLLVVPAVAVDRQGVRLGRGGGSYDRVLARVPAGIPVVALLHDGELLAGPVPADPHDRRVTAVITPALGLVQLPATGCDEAGTPQ